MSTYQSSNQGAVVSIFLRGGMDGMHAAMPAADPQYLGLRPNLGQAAQAATDLDGFFRLHAALEPVHDIYHAGHLAMVHAVGAPDSTHSHFDAQDYLDHGTPGDKSTSDGWLARAIASTQPVSPLAGVAMGNKVVESMRHASQSIISVSTLENVGLVHPLAGMDLWIDAMAAGDDLLGPITDATFAAVETLQALPDPGNTNLYPNSPFGQQMSDVARMLKAVIGIQAVALDIGGWDSHADEETMLTTRFDDLARGLRVFFEDMGGLMQSTTVLVMSEFGRRAYENASGGTDHGTAGCMMVMGDGIKGGQVFTQWPGLSSNQLNHHGDLMPTTDYREVVSELLDARHYYPDLGTVFPGFSSTGYLGLV